ncbi:hypothetical protein EDC56_3532 [Sinobacterium caligoides]|uniref:Uncharacterized protein n=1 Tax=Sinobacterium caligoides TaxID=933926 RepID=A0A3N2DDJ1_9GAMM|nr:hypothetical protein EDC56_3532 [Sinobacterium caligoides]
MHPELKHILGALFYTVAYVISPIAFVVGVGISGPLGILLCILSIASISIGYVWAGLKKIPTTPKNAAIEMLFWFICGCSVIFTMWAITMRSWPAFSMLLISSGASLLVWRLTSKSIRTRIKRAPII